MLRNRTERQSGLTMFEVMVASMILFALVAMSSYLVWTSSKHVSSSESALQLEFLAREMLNSFTMELRQTRFASVEAIAHGSVSENPALLAPSQPTPGTTQVIVPGVDFYAIRFKIPGGTMDLTKNNAKNFNLTGFKNTTLSPDWTNEIQYWWAPDVSQDEGVETPAFSKIYEPDGEDDNKNWVVDEGVINKIETFYDTANPPNVIRRVKSVVCRDVQIAGPASAPPAFWPLGKLKVGLVFRVLDAVPDPNGVAQGPNRIEVTLTLEKADPQNKKQSIVKKVSTVIEMRNN